MDVNLGRLIAAARRVDTRIAPVRQADGGSITFSADDVRGLLAGVTRAAHSSADGNRIRGLLSVGLTSTGERTLSERESLILTGALNRLADSSDRARRIDRGQIPGAMSSSEAVRLMRRLGRL